jgi:hypothetical protein
MLVSLTATFLRNTIVGIGDVCHESFEQKGAVNYKQKLRIRKSVAERSNS